MSDNASSRATEHREAPLDERALASRSDWVRHACSVAFLPYIALLL
jgi:hypothetical protein